MHHCSTVQQRGQLVSQLLADARQHGLVSQLSRDHQVSRQTLYRWKAKVEEAIQEALSSDTTKNQQKVDIQRAVLILFVEAYGSYRGIQICMKELFGEDMSLETIGSIVNKAGNCAQKLLVQQKPTKDCALALDEQYSSKRGEAYLNIVDVHSSVVWATMPPVAVDAESWTILLWYMQEQGVTCPRLAQRDATLLSGSQRVEKCASLKRKNRTVLNKEVNMTSIANSSVKIQTTSESNPSPPCWFGEVVLLITSLRKNGILTRISEGVRFARRRFGHYEVIDFLAVLFGYAISGERTLEEFYEHLQPFAVPFMALFERDQLPCRSALSRFLAALTQVPVEALRTLFLDDLLSRPLLPDKQTGSLMDRVGNSWMVFDIDGTREAARQRALPQRDDLPPPSRRLDEVCAAGYRGRKRGQVVRTRTVVSQAHSFQWLGSFGNRGNGRYREELRQGLSAIRRYLTGYQLPQACTLLRLDGQYGTGAALSELAGFVFVTGGKDYTVLDHPLIQARLHLPPDQFQQRPQSQMVRSRDLCPAVLVGSQGVTCRVVVATHKAGKKKSPVGVTRAGIVYELFFTTLPQHAFTACDVVERYLHRGAFEPTLSDEDREQDPDRWCSHSAWGQECWQVVSQWVWNLRLELGHQLHPDPVRTTDFAPAIPPQSEQVATLAAHSPPASGYAPPTTATSWKAGRFCGQDFTLQPDGTVRCPADQKLLPHEQRREADGSLRIVYGASIGSCRPCPLREQCQCNGHTTAVPRQVSVLLHPLPVGSAALLWRDWSRREHRRACMQLAQHQRLQMSLSPPSGASPPPAGVILSRAQRAHSRLSWQERLARNVRHPAACQITIKLFGIPERFAASLGLATA